MSFKDFLIEMMFLLGLQKLRLLGKVVGLGIFTLPLRLTWRLIFDLSLTDRLRCFPVVLRPSGVRGSRFLPGVF